MSKDQRSDEPVRGDFTRADVEFIKTAYQAVLNRQPDPVGLNYYLSRLANGFSRSEILDQLCRSPEAKAQRGDLGESNWLIQKVKSVPTRILRSRSRGNRNTQQLLRELPNQPTKQTDANDHSSHLDEQVRLVRDISEGLVHAVQGLQQAIGRHEQSLATLHTAAEQGSAVENEVVIGLGLAVRSMKTVLKRHEKSFVMLRSELGDSLGTEIRRVESRQGVLDERQILQAKMQADLKEGEARLVARLGELHEECTALSNLLANRSEQDGVPRVKLAAFEKEQERIGDIVRSCDASNRTVALKMDALDQKAHWLSVDNDNLRKRIEFVRKEVMFELRRATSQGKLGGAAICPSRTPDNLDRDHRSPPPFEFPADAPRRVNLGCGHLALEGFTNLDARDLPGVDIVADLRRLPFAPASIDELRATHVIEHFTEHSLLTEVLPHWASVMRQGATLTVTAPDAKAIMADVVAGTIDWETAKVVLMGGQEYEGDFHFALLDPAEVCAMLETAGFAAAKVIAEARPNGDCLEFEIIATR